MRSVLLEPELAGASAGGGSVSLDAPVVVEDAVKARGYWELVWIRFRRDKMAIAAAPYIHAKLMVHKVGGPDGGAVPLAISGRVYVFLPDNGRRVIDVTPNATEQLTEAAAKAGALAIEAAATSAAEQEEEETEQEA